MAPNLPSQTPVVIIGGGIIGLSTLYHLAARGVQAVLLERRKLASGTTWHAAGIVGQLRDSTAQTALGKYTAKLFRDLEAETGQATGYKQIGTLNLALGEVRHEQLLRQHNHAARMEVESEILDREQIAALWPTIRVEDVRSGLIVPSNGQVNALDVATALSKGARARGGQVFEDCRVERLDIQHGRVRAVVTEHGTIATDVYGGTVNLFSNSLRQIGIEVRWADPADPENFRKLSDDRTRAFFGETLPNPKLQVFPIGEVAQIGEELGIPLIVDNTAAPIICKLIKHGAHIVIHSTTKYIGGQGTSIGGVILDSGRFDWEGNAARFPLLNQPDASYHGAVWVEAVKPLGPIAFILKARVTVQRDYGFALSPQNAFQFIQGLETLALRFERQNENAAKVADYLGSHPDVVRVIYANAQEGAALERAGKYLDGGAGALVGFEHKGGLEAGKAFINALSMLYHVANIGDNRSLAIHPASTTHSQLPPEQQAAAGVTPGYVRLSIGIERADDIIADIDQALNAATSSLAVAA